jgi:hypothetical protein
MADPKVEKKAQDDFLRSQRQTAPQIVIGSSVSSSTGIPAEGLILKPSKRTKEEEERLAKTPPASMGGASVNKPLTGSDGSYVGGTRTKTDQR